ncbi:MAG: dGTP triphosphohydrolase [Fibrobacterota bacterium]
MKFFDAYLKDRRFRNSVQRAEDQRNPFENDFSRVVFSSSFRRLQDKTQVFQLDKGDFVRTRLTHSIEVSSLGRSIGLSVENRLIDDGLLSEEKRGCIPSILATAGLVHDIGNPPFGHFGEWAIQSYFRNFFAENSDIAQDLSKQQKQDILNFDGNVQTFRVLRKLHYIKDREGMNMTFAVLASIVKYPVSSLTGNRSGAGLSRKKFGFFASESQDYADIAGEFSLSGRYPLTFLLEAADDIAYSIADIEDACKKGLIGYFEIIDFLQEHLTPLSMTLQEQEQDFITLFQDLYRDVNNSYKNKLELAVQRFRIAVQRFMIEAAVDEFCSHITEICSGSYDRDLLENSAARNIRSAFKALGNHIFAHKSIIEKEIIGYNVITYLLDEFVPAVLQDSVRTNPKKPRMYNLISSNYRFIYENFSDRSTYSRIQLALDYISGMTDNFALKRYRTFQGMEQGPLH